MATETAPTQLPIEQFESELQGVCGCFDLTPSPESKTVWGAARLTNPVDLEIALVANDLQRVARNRKHIRQDGSENYFLVVQQEGRALMTQNNTSSVLLPGDMVLINSARPSEFSFFGNRSSQVSLHLPRAEFEGRFTAAVDGGQALSRGDQTAKAISAVISKVLNGQSNHPGSGYAKDVIYGLLGMFLQDANAMKPAASAMHEAEQGSILGIALEQIETRFRNPDFTVGAVSASQGIKPRQLQRAFAPVGITPSRYLLVTRLEFARSLLLRKTDVTISSIAYESGFADLSYFNRRFKQAFGCTPREYKYDNCTGVRHGLLDSCFLLPDYPQKPNESASGR